MYWNLVRLDRNRNNNNVLLLIWSVNVKYHAKESNQSNEIKFLDCRQKLGKLAFIILYLKR